VKLTGSQLAKKFPVFYVTWTFITAFTRGCYLSLSWGNHCQPYPISQCFMPYPASMQNMVSS